MSPRRPRAEGDEGLAFIMMGLGLVALVTFVAIVVDLGNGRQEKRHIQNAVDAASLAGSTKYVSGDEGTKLLAMDEAMRYLRLNDVPAPNSSTVDGDGLPVLEYSCVGGQTCDIEFDFGPGRCLWIEVREYEVPTFFAGVIGVDELNVKSSASGCVEPGPPGPGTVTSGPDVPAGWAGGVCSGTDPGFDTSGNWNRFEGGIRAIDNPKDGSGNAEWTGARSYRGNIVQVGSLWAATPAPAPVAEGAATGAEWPPGFGSALPISLYAPGGDRALAYHQFYATSSSGTFSLTGRVPGVYYLTSKDVVITGSPTLTTTKTAQIYIDPATGLPAKPVANGGAGVVETRTLTGITLVHAGRGKLVRSEDNLDLRAFELELNRLVIFSNSDSEKTTATEWCVNPVVEFGGRCNHVDGVIYTPRGAISNNGNANGQSFNDGVSHGHPNHGESCTHGHSSWKGGMIGYGLKLAGNANLYRGGPGSLISTPGPPGPDDYYLRE